MNPNPITLGSVINCENNSLINLLDPLLSKVTGLSKINQLYRGELAGLNDKELFERALQVFGVEAKLIEEQLQNIPKTGPVIVISNHPYGIHDALLLGWLLGSVREDYKILANRFFANIEEIKPRIIPVNPFKSCQDNLRGLKEAIHHLNTGGVLGLFPAGSVSHFQWKKWSVTDGAWPETISRLVKMTGADVVPIHFSGRNSLLFQIAGLIHPSLRTALLPREVFRSKKPITLKIGKPVKGSYLKKMDNAGMIDYLRMRCFLLKEGRVCKSKSSSSSSDAPIIAAVPKQRLKEDVASLSSGNLLFSQGDCDVCIATADKIPSVLREIGRLREVTFRKAGEGTGNPIDLDSYDETYHHLFVWNKHEKEIVGAYRLGHVDRILDKQGCQGLYTSEFYQYTEEFLTKHRMALELGRSFIREEYQKKPYSLFLLWKGICSYLARHPQYRYLIGAVSVSNDYHHLSRALIANLLKEGKVSLKSKMPPKIKINKEVRSFCKLYQTSSFEDLSVLIKSIENDEKDIPVLLRQYLKLGGRFYSFCEDKNFHDTLDGLIVVDFPNAPLKSLKMLIGDDTDKYLYFHRNVSFQKR